MKHGIYPTAYSDPDYGGQLPLNVMVGELSMPWNAQDGVSRLSRLGHRERRLELVDERGTPRTRARAE